MRRSIGLAAVLTLLAATGAVLGSVLAARSQVGAAADLGALAGATGILEGTQTACGRARSIVAANAVVLNDTIVPNGAIAVGSPAAIKEGRARREMITEGVDVYVTRSRRFRDELRRIG